MERSKKKINAWIKQIAVSNRIKNIENSSNDIDVRDILNNRGVRNEVIKIRTMCPALIFAASRKDSVNGRTSTLIDSKITRAGFNHIGAPSGNKWAKNSLGLKIALEITMDSQHGRAIETVKIIWEVHEKL